MSTLIGEAASHVTTRARRRALVAAAYLSFAASVAVSRFASADHVTVVGISASALLMLALTAYLVLMHLTHHSRTNPPALLDERGLAVRDQAYRRAYGLACALVATALAYAWLAARTGWGPMPERPRDWAGLLAVACYLLVSFPPAVIAWTEPDVPVEDAEDAARERETLRGIPLTPLRLRLMLGLAATAVLLEVAQLAGVGVLPERWDDALAGLATALLFGAALLWGWRRRENHRNS
ncbi:MAG TPA: hypothetical protein VF615_14785 [Longimicrobiaceae bacterium]|jgi:hypothetical protein